MPDASQPLTVKQEEDAAAAQAATVEAAKAAEATKDPRDVRMVQAAAAATGASQARVAEATSVAMVVQTAGAAKAPQEAAPAASKADVVATVHLREEPLSRPLVDLTVAPAPAMAGEVAPALEATEDREALALLAATAEEAAGGDATN